MSAPARDARLCSVWTPPSGGRGSARPMARAPSSRPATALSAWAARGSPAGGTVRRRSRCAAACHNAARPLDAWAGTRRRHLPGSAWTGASSCGQARAAASSLGPASASAGEHWPGGGEGASRPPGSGLTATSSAERPGPGHECPGAPAGFEILLRPETPLALPPPPSPRTARSR